MIEYHHFATFKELIIILSIRFQQLQIFKKVKIRQDVHPDKRTHQPRGI